LFPTTYAAGQDPPRKAEERKEEKERGKEYERMRNKKRGVN
jgi:hypothetical protein